MLRKSVIFYIPHNAWTRFNMKWINYKIFPTWIWDSAVCDELCEKNTETPDIWLDGEPGVVCRLGGSPLDGEPGTNPSLIFVFLD